MHHRHLAPGFESSVAAVADVLERGSLADWRELAGHIQIDPDGPYARAVRRVVEHSHFYGTTILWTDYLDRINRAGEGRPPMSEMTKTSEPCER